MCNVIVCFPVYEVIDFEIKEKAMWGMLFIVRPEGVI